MPTFNRINFRIKIQFRQKLNSIILAQELFYRNIELLTIGNKIISAKFLPIINVCFWQFCNCLFYHALHRKHIKKIGILPTQSWNLFRANNYTKHTVKNHTIYSFPYLDKNLIKKKLIKLNIYHLFFRFYTQIIPFKNTQKSTSIKLLTLLKSTSIKILTPLKST